MEEVIRAMDSVREHFSHRDTVDEEVKPLHEASKRWAAMSLDTFADDLLRRALDVSLAISAFTVQFERDKAHITLLAPKDASQKG